MILFYVNWQIRGKFRRFPVNRSAFSVIAENFKFLQIMQLVCADVLIAKSDRYSILASQSHDNGEFSTEGKKEAKNRNVFNDNCV